jgi:hypothetical protein
MERTIKGLKIITKKYLKRAKVPRVLKVEKYKIYNIITILALSILDTLGTQLLKYPHNNDKFAANQLIWITDGSSMWNYWDNQCRKNNDF